MIDITFCELLEYRITTAFQNSADGRLKGYWCDGVLLPTFENEYGQAYVHRNKRIFLTAFIGADGQDPYEIDLIFGQKALAKYANGVGIADCIPDFETMGGFYIDESKKRIQINLL